MGTITYLLFAFGAFGALVGCDRRVFCLQDYVAIAADRASRRLRVVVTLLGFFLSFAGRHHSLSRERKLEL